MIAESVKVKMVFLAAVFFALDAFRIQNKVVSWTPAAFCCLVIALFLIG